MYRLFGRSTVLGLLLCLVCVSEPPARAQVVTSYWQECRLHPGQWDLYSPDGVHLGSYSEQDDRYLPKVDGQWGSECESPAPLPVARKPRKPTEPWMTAGVVTPPAKKRGGGFSHSRLHPEQASTGVQAPQTPSGQPAPASERAKEGREQAPDQSRPRAKARKTPAERVIEPKAPEPIQQLPEPTAPEPAPQIPHYEQMGSCTIICPDAARREEILHAVQTAPELAWVREAYPRLKAYPPGDWAVRGFKLDQDQRYQAGQLGVYCQSAPDAKGRARVEHRANVYSSPEQLAGALHDPDENYNPNAVVSPAPPSILPSLHLESHHLVYLVWLGAAAVVVFICVLVHLVKADG